MHDAIIITFKYARVKKKNKIFMRASIWYKIRLKRWEKRSLIF
jgi:hypothetical protein